MDNDTLEQIYEDLTADNFLQKISNKYGLNTELTSSLLSDVFEKLHEVSYKTKGFTHILLFIWKFLGPKCCYHFSGILSSCLDDSGAEEEYVSDYKGLLNETIARTNSDVIKHSYTIDKWDFEIEKDYKVKT